jgi:ABC-type sugar transport system permease subunit
MCCNVITYNHPPKISVILLVNHENSTVTRQPHLCANPFARNIARDIGDPIFHSSHRARRPSILGYDLGKWLIADRGGLVNIVLQALGVGPIYFLSESGWAMVAVTVIKIWRSFPFMMLTLLAALQVIDRNLYEAAKLDGANSWGLFWHITLPHLRNISIVQAILMVIWSINDFETPYLLTQGGPSNATENLILLSYRYTFGRDDVGRGSAVALLTLVLLMALATLIMRQQRTAT